MHSKDEEKEEYKKKQRERWTASAPTFVQRKNGWTAHSGQDGGLDESGEPNQEVAVATEAADTEKEATKTQRQQRTQRPQRPRLRKKRPQRHRGNRGHIGHRGRGYGKRGHKGRRGNPY